MELKDYDLVTELIKCSSLTVSEKSPRLNTLHPPPTAAGWPMNPNCLSQERAERMTKIELWAWGRAYHEAIGKDVREPTRKDAKVMGAEFLRLVSLP